ncbi:hypothetical protein KY362_00615 [Candidatus Woesearchaeota archaeon]|nr:hypothetical protein [Candidatus Woesearchaeota archaeon]
MELPQYMLKPNINRMVVPSAFQLFGLALLFYAGVYFLTMSMGLNVPGYINLFIIAFLVVLIVAQLFLYHMKFGKYKYEFYTNRIEFSGKKPATFMFTDFQQAELKQNLFDKMFNTGSIKLGKDFKIGPITNPERVKSYTEKLVNYYQSIQRGLKIQQQRAEMQKEAEK